ncbi:MAG: ABC transporter permease [Fusobacteria bacterium]|nr:ABC transporter permease [Fusobacteriota bacterium]
MKRKKGLIIGIVALLVILAVGLFAPENISSTLASFIAQDLRIALPLAVAAAGLVYGERSGVLNLGAEGLMLTGALFTWLGTSLMGGNPWLGSLLGMFSSFLMALLFAFLVITLRSNQTVIGVSINILALGLTSTIYRVVQSMEAPVYNFPSIAEVLSKLPVLGPVLTSPTETGVQLAIAGTSTFGNYLNTILSQNVMVYIGIAFIIFLQFVLFKTDLGLKVRAVGEYPKACDTLGINVFRIRYGAVLFSSLLAGFAGGLLVLDIKSFAENMTAGKGFIAIAAVIFGKYTPIGALGASLVFGGAQALQYLVQAIGWKIPGDLMNMIPYLVTIIALAGFIGKTHKPAASTIPYTKE